jgi:hypothetical protein
MQITRRQEMRFVLAAKILNENSFNLEESAALLHAIFPKYPDLRG